jgi:light-regulated signal transduction histidine kinase (bacteriophytochrome)
MAMQQTGEGEAQVALVKMQAQLADLVHVVGHDLRAPLRHITAYGQLVKEQLGAGGDPQAAVAYTESMVQAAHRMGVLIDGLVALLRLDQVEMQPMRLDTVALVEEVLSKIDADRKLAFPGNAIEWQVATDFPPVQGDPALIRRVWQQLLDNAVKFSAPRTPARIEIGWEEQAGPTGARTCRFFVRDNGVGFNPAYTDQLFGVFQRLHGARQFAGEGLGLASCRKIIERHGGTVGAQGAVDAGCTVHFTLPL